MPSEIRTALITGASSGIGAAIAIEMAAQGWKLAIGSRRLDRLTATAEKARTAGAAEVHAGVLDVTDDASVERFFEQSEDALGVADVIVNNAGASRFHWLDESDTRWFRREVETNLIGPMLVTHSEIDADPHPTWRRRPDEAPLYRNERPTSGRSRGVGCQTNCEYHRR